MSDIRLHPNLETHWAGIRKQYDSLHFRAAPQTAQPAAGFPREQNGKTWPERLRAAPQTAQPVADFPREQNGKTCSERLRAAPQAAQPVIDFPSRQIRECGISGIRGLGGIPRTAKMAGESTLVAQNPISPYDGQAI